MDPERILVGQQGLHPPSHTFPIQRVDELLVIETPPAWDDRAGVWCLIWKLEETKISLEGEDLEVLRDLGYTDD